MRTHARGRSAALFTSVVMMSAAVVGVGPAGAVERGSGRTERPLPPASAPLTLPTAVDGGSWKSGHLQGTAVDRRKGHMYFSFTNLLVKTDMSGKPIGSVTGFTGHLGDLDFNKGDGRVYGSLEYKAAKAFYIAVFDADRITRMDMDAQSTGVVSTVHLKEVVADYTADMDGDGDFDGDTADTADHRYGCSGIDGVAFGPSFDRAGGEKLTVAYGVYANTGREDNDNQVLLQYDISAWRGYEKPLTESAPHTSGPAAPDGKYFVYTGNTTYGVQNLEYDAKSGDWLMAAYKGTKTTFPNYSLFVVDGSKRPVLGPVRGQRPSEPGQNLHLRATGLHDAASGVYGYRAAGQYGLVSLDDGRFYVATSGTTGSGENTRQTGRAVLHRWTGGTPDPFTPERRR
ncbi:hypothetical protein [Streptomyces sp. NRRL F-5135]|uniref:hypothetical protein n=1 Tax=Streptomyces sp. NRRL F-5135 TaxID=1463858 RepID=UPI0004C9F0B4|nr:hypothetical protein [Streptomyces sp. NRRL F-5135]